MDDLHVETPPTSPPPPQPSGLKQIRTFQGDVADALSRQNESLYSIQHGEALKRGSATQVGAPSHKLVFFGAGLALIVIASAGAWFTYTVFLEKTAPPVIAVPQNRFISAESETTIDISTLTRDSLFQAITGSSDGTRPTELRHIILKSDTSTEATIAQFMTKLESSAPGSLVRAFKPSFMLGTLGTSRFMIIKLSSYENAFGGMLNWEPNIVADLAGLFANAEVLKSIGPENVFKDIVSKNKDVRAIYSDANLAFMYSFLGQDYLIITDRLETLSTLIDRLTRETLTR